MREMPDGVLRKRSGKVSRRSRKKDDSMGQVFSLVDGFVWASWPGTVFKVRMGTYEIVTAMMGDFLAQCALGERLANGKPRSDWADQA